MASKEEVRQLLEENAKSLNQSISKAMEQMMDKKLDPIKSTMGLLVEASMRREAGKMFGRSFAKRFLIRSLNDAVHLLTKAKYKDLLPSAEDRRKEVSSALVNAAATLVVPLAKAVRLSYAKQFGVDEQAETYFQGEDYFNALGMLLKHHKGLNYKIQNRSIVLYLERIKKAFLVSDATATAKATGMKSIDLQALLTCEGPGVMLIELASRYDSFEELEKEDNIFQGLTEMIEEDLRGTISLVEKHATISLGEIKTSSSAVGAAKRQLALRTRFMKTVIQKGFPDTFDSFVLIGHIFIQAAHANENRKQIPSDSVEDLIGRSENQGRAPDKISFYIHAF